MKNWNDLSTKLKFKCIGAMDFKTRFCLRATSKTEKVYCDLAPMPIESVEIKQENSFFYVEICQKKSTIFNIKTKQIYFIQETILPLLNYILEKHHVEKWVIPNNENIEIMRNGPEIEDVFMFKLGTSEYMKKLEEEIEVMRVESLPKTGWMELPDELKMECIKDLSIERRWTLRQVSHNFKDLIDSMKLQVSSFHLTDLSLSVKSDTENIVLDFHRRRRLFCAPFIAFLLRNLLAESVQIDVMARKFSQSIITKLPLSNVFEAKKLMVKYDGCPWFQRMKKAENIVFECEWHLWPNIQEFLRIDAIQKTPFFQLTDAGSVLPMKYVIKEWIENPPKIGTEFQLSSKWPVATEDFREVYEPNPIVQDENFEEIRVRTSDVAKTIVAFRLKEAKRFFCIVISSELKSFEKNDRWI